MRLAIAIGVLLASTEAAAGAARETAGLAVVAFGDCRDASLLEAARAVRHEVASRQGARALSEEATAAPAGGLPGPALAEIRRVIESGKADFLNLETERAEKTLRAVLPEIDRLPLGPQRWEAFWETRAWLARILQYTNQRPKASELFLQVLKVNEEFQLNRVDFPPSARELLEMSRSLLAGLPRFKLAVSSKLGKGQVYLNGFAVGPAPFEKRLTGGEYEIAVMDGAKKSFVRRVALLADQSVVVDLERESGYGVDGGPCYRSGSERDERLAAVTFLASALGADQVVAVRLEKLSGEDYVAAALVEVAKGREVREGRVRREAGRLPALGRLAQFALTGEGSPTPNPEKAPSPALAKAPAGPAVQSGGSTGESDLFHPWQRPVTYALWGAALVLGGVGLYEHVHAGDCDREAATLVDVNGAVKNPSEVGRYNSLLSSASGARSAGTGLAVAAGILAVGGGATLIWSFYSGGASVAVAGSF